MTDDERELEMLEEFDRQRDRLQQALQHVAATIRHEMRGMTPEDKAWLLYDVLHLCAERLLDECPEDARDWACRWTEDVLSYIYRWKAWHDAGGNS